MVFDRAARGLPAVQPRVIIFCPAGSRVQHSTVCEHCTGFRVESNTTLYLIKSAPSLNVGPVIIHPTPNHMAYVENLNMYVPKIDVWGDSVNHKFLMYTPPNQK